MKYLGEPITKQVRSELEILIVTDNEVWLESEHDKPHRKKENARNDRYTNLCHY
jgi:hypothetical protein